VNWNRRPPRGPARLLFLAFLLAWLSSSYAFTFPPLTGRVVDQANLLAAADRVALEAKLKDLEDKSGIQLVVATVNSLEGSDVETYGNQLFRNWKLGEAKKNNGVLLLIAPHERKVRIESGYGLEGTLTDALAKVIIAGTILPRFKAGDYAGGIERGVDGIIAVLTTDAAEWQPKPKVRDDEPTTFDALLPLIVLALLLFMLIYMVRHARGSSGQWRRRGGRTIFIPYGGSWGSPGGWSSGPGWGGGSPGNGGFAGGGGSSGGGGASGSW
jgi:uncharacterized protein